MARQLTTRAQVNGYRFMIRRLEHALLRRDVRMIDDPMRSHLNALVAGAVLAVIVLAGCAVWGLLRPQGTVGDAVILADKGSGGLYVRLDQTVHPVMNLASARLITGRADAPTSVSSSVLARYARGPLLGIPGAPSALGRRDSGTTWSVCDSVHGQSGNYSGAVDLSVLAGDPDPASGVTGASARTGVLVTQNNATHLIYHRDRGGRLTAVRAEVDMGSPEILDALGLIDRSPRPISAALLNTFPEVPALRVPEIPGRGAAGVLDDASAPVGSVIKTVGIDDAVRYYVVLSQSLQEIGRPAAEALRMADEHGAAEVIAVSAARVADVPKTTVLPVTEFPDDVPELVDSAVSPTICQSWRRSADGAAAEVTLLTGTGLPLTGGATPVAVAGADGAGPGVDQVHLPPGGGEFVVVTGAEPDSARSESLYYVSDSGVRFGVENAEAAGSLGLTGTPAAVPWGIVSLLPAGPTLARADALVAHDGVAADADGVPITVSDK